VLNVKYYCKQIGRGPDGLRTRLSTCVRVFLKTHEMTRLVTNTERFKTHGSRHLYAAGSRVLECVVSKYMPMIFFYFLKIIFDISILK